MRKLQRIRLKWNSKFGGGTHSSPATLKQEVVMSIRGQIIQYMYAGDRDPLSHCLKQTDDATSPVGVVSAVQGTHLLMDYNGNAVDKDVWINTDGSTAWTQIHNETA